MMTPEGFEEMVLALMHLGYTRDVAEDYAARIGDTPEPDAQGLWIIRDDQGNIIDRIRPMLED